MKWTISLTVLLSLAAAPARADVGAPDVAEPAAFEAAWTDALGSFDLPCSGVDFAGCCEAGVLFFCNDRTRLDAIECARNEDYTACAMHEDPALGNCMLPGAPALEAPRCSSVPAPPPGQLELPDPDELAGTCPTLPRNMLFTFDEAPYCEGIPQEVTIHQLGCAFVMTPPTGDTASVTLGHMNGRVIQMSYRVGGGATIATCLGEVSADDTMIRGRCEGSWGFGDDACRFSFKGPIDWSWEAPAPVVEPPTRPDTDVVSGETGGDAGNGGGGCTAAPTPGAPGALLLLAVVLAALAFRRRVLRS